MQKENLIYSCHNVTLKSLTINEAETIRCLRNKDENRFCFTNSDIISFDMQQKWFENYLKSNDDYMFSIFLKDSSTFIGTVAIYNFQKETNSAEFGRLLIDKSIHCDKGIGVEVTKCTCKIAANLFNLTSLFLKVYSDNIPAIKTYLRSGFIKTQETNINDRKLDIMKIKLL